jgi:hypothetical protein
MMLLRWMPHPSSGLNICVGLLLQVSRARWALGSSQVLAQLRGELHVWTRPLADLRGLCWRDMQVVKFKRSLLGW